LKIAISTDGDFVSEHFGRCPSFTFIETDAGKLTSRTTIENPGHHPGFLPQFLHEHGVHVIVAGGMGQRALMLFAQAGIKAILGVSGPLEDVIQRLLSGTLKGGESLCRPGAGKGYGVDKTECEHGQHDHGHTD